MEKKRILCLLVIVVATVMSVLKRFNIAYPDSQQYAIMLDNLLGRGTGAEANIPFAFRPLVPILGIPFGLFMASDVALSIVSLIASVGLGIVIFYICKEFTEYDVVAMVITLFAVNMQTFINYGASALTDSVAMLFVACIMLATLRDSDWRIVFFLVVVGVLARELVLFGALFYLLYMLDLRGIIVMLCGLEVTLVIRDVISGTPYQALPFHVPQDWAMNTVVSALEVLVCLSTLLIVAWVRHSKDVENGLWMLAVGLISFIPYCLLGIFCAYFDLRFVWPLQMVFLGVISVGLGSSYDAVLRRLKE